jgi:hypothetical protein
MANLFLHLPEGPTLAVEYPHAVEISLICATLSEEERGKLESLLKPSRKIPPRRETD